MARPIVTRLSSDGGFSVAHHRIDLAIAHDDRDWYAPREFIMTAPRVGALREGIRSIASAKGAAFLFLFAASSACSNAVRRPIGDGAFDEAATSYVTPIPEDLPACSPVPVRCGRGNASCSGDGRITEVVMTCGSGVRVAYCDRVTGRCTCTPIGQPSCSCRITDTSEQAFRCGSSIDLSISVAANCCWEQP